MNLLSISEMAELHNISRQTLIYYDKIELFKPDHVDEHGYRYYSPYQIPFLREICFLKSVGIKLEHIKNHIKDRNITTAISLLDCHRDYIDREIDKLLKTRNSIERRLNTYLDASKYKEELYKPIIESFNERKAIFYEYKNTICKEELHLTMMNAWNDVISHGIIPSGSFGTIIMKDQLDTENIFKNSGGFTEVPEAISNIQNIITLPAGQYVCLYKYGMPYDTEPLYSLIEWIKDNNYKIVGNIIDICALDTTFYKDDTKVDFCQLQIPVEKVI